jgi:hypothetical protein
MQVRRWCIVRRIIRLSIFGVNKALDKVGDIIVCPILMLKGLTTNRPESKRQELLRLNNELQSRRQELRWTRDRLIAAEKQHRDDYKKRKKRIQQEIFRLENDLRRFTEEPSNGAAPNAPLQAPSELPTGALPDFLIIGAKKGGTTFLYDLLSRHPYVEPAAKKELHYFDILVEDEGIDWYRRCFPSPRWKEGQRTISGEATPYLDDPRVPERVAKVLPQARLIALLRDPVERAYSDYQQVCRKGREHLSFEEAVDAEMNQPTPLRWYLSRGVYINHLLPWAKFFDDEQILVLKSEDLFERTQETLGRVLDFLNLPSWELRSEASEKKRNKGAYEAQMEPALRQRLEEYFEAHNQRLYEYLGIDFEWQQLHAKS